MRNDDTRRDRRRVVAVSEGAQRREPAPLAIPAIPLFAGGEPEVNEGENSKIAEIADPPDSENLVSAPSNDEAWRDELAAQLEANPELRYVYRAGLPEDGLVKLYVAVRDVATAYFTIPAERYDPITAMMELSRLADQHYPAVDPHPYADPLR